MSSEIGNTKKWFLAIAGNIGAGKSTLVARMAGRLGWQPFYEPVTENPYLLDFYQDMRAWAFHSQVFFLTRRLRAHRQLISHPTSAIQDRCVYEDAEIFARNLHRQGMIDNRDYRAYSELYEILCEFLPPPDLIVYLQASTTTLQERIRLRGRDYERQISRAYIEQLNHLYDDWAESFHLCPLLTVATDHLDFVGNEDHLDWIIREVFVRLMP